MPETIFVAGRNDAGQLGTGDKVNVAEWTEIPIPQELRDDPDFAYYPHSVSTSKGNANQHTLIMFVGRKRGA